jgi:hypothetical protein
MQSLGVATVVLCVLSALVGCGKVAASCPPEGELLSDRENCGACGHACGADEVCGNGTCMTCAQDQTLCGDSCVAMDSDVLNCGGCGIACNVGEACIAGECAVPCDTAQLSSPIADPWGVTWDGLERPAAALDVAGASCKDFGARLPTATELHRVSATQSGLVGQSFHVNYLWSQAPDDKLNQAVIRLSDGGTSTRAALSTGPYRCVCPPVLPRTFSGGHCNGPPGGECFTAGGYNFDVADRPALRKSAAVWECTNERAHLADLPRLVEAIQAGLPGSNLFISTADASDNHQSSEIRWNATSWSPAGNTAAVDLRTPAPFRCAAPALAVSANPNTIANEFLGPLSRYKGETSDSAALVWAAAHDACTSRGGHLPRATELAELIMQGLPNGSGQSLWSADQVGSNSTQYLVAANSWTALDQRYSYAFGGADQTATWAYKTTSQLFRCIYYPLDPAYVAPTGCAGDCFTVTLPGDPAPRMWFDSVDRPATTLADAVADCAAAGGHLPSERDLTEAIRAGLPNGIGTTTYLYTSDFAQLKTTVVRWTGTGSAAYTDQNPAYMTWSDQVTLRPHRCMWTNEQR